MSVLICAGDWNIRQEIPPSDPVLSVRPDLTSHILLIEILRLAKDHGGKCNQMKWVEDADGRFSC